MLELKKVVCERNDRWLFNPVDLTLQAGELVHLCGPNGSGKTSLLRIICGLLVPTEGDVVWQGQSTQAVPALNQTFLYLGHRNGLKASLTPLENLDFMVALKNMATRPNKTALNKALAVWGLGAYQQHLSGRLSAGQQRKIALAQLSLSTQTVWLLDEPFTALDARHKQILTSVLVEHRQRGGITVFTSHEPVAMTHIHSFHLSDFQHA